MLFWRRTQQYVPVDIVILFRCKHIFAEQTVKPAQAELGSGVAGCRLGW